MAVKEPSVRVTDTDSGVPGGAGVGGAGEGAGGAGGVGAVYGPAGDEFRQPLKPAPLRARTATMYVSPLEALIVMLVPV